MLICPITGNVNFEHQVKVAPASFLPCKVSTFPFVINKYLVGRYFQSM